MLRDIPVTDAARQNTVEMSHLTRPKQRPTDVASLCVTAQVPGDVCGDTDAGSVFTGGRGGTIHIP